MDVQYLKNAKKEKVSKGRFPSIHHDINNINVKIEKFYFDWLINF